MVIFGLLNERKPGSRRGFEREGTRVAGRGSAVVAEGISHTKTDPTHLEGAWANCAQPRTTCVMLFSSPLFGFEEETWVIFFSNVSSTSVWVFKTRSAPRLFPRHGSS